ncbi:SusC/RagA family TonB-linked outer membrane protein [Niabella ginsenosidivorans]|uniref:SusC/RagA family TonB-linked outer membrane protein n=1 Tax=Niabella ginsenosidivorans TaxID=1176587 RepID=A0A1A9I6E8_9BACT|nr:TonB-dependent receptor [Niabella ginsenosidivorans]ANH83248.1 SusC/RagA family TonB-linked outer membrane protein [Niabella ginsenosidivorans]
MSKPSRLCALRAYYALFYQKSLLLIAILLFTVTSSSVLAKTHPLYDKVITGTVTDQAGQPLSGVSVLLKGTSTGVTTNNAGVFTIRVPDTGGTLVFSHIGFAEQEVAVGEKQEITVTLIASATDQLADVVVVGYGTQKKAVVSGAVTSVRGADLQKSPATNLSNSLAGRLPGVTAVQTTGEPGYDGSKIRIRGTNSLGNSDALIVIDGVPNRAGGLERLNPADIESISVLKDASAAIYGSRAGNGVILITTKQGKSGKPRVNYDFSYGWQRPTRTPQMSDAAEYATIRNELKIYDNVPTDEWAAAAAAFASTGSYTLKDNSKTVAADFTADDIQKYRDGSDPLGHPNTDWYKTTLKTWSPQQKHNLQISGGSENARYMASLGYLDQDGYYRKSATGYSQYDLRVNLDVKVSKHIRTSVNVVAREEDRHFPTLGAGDIFRMIMRGKPTEIEVWPNGLPGPDIEYGQNPYVITTSLTGYDKDIRDYFQSNGKVEIDIPGIEGLKLTGTASIDKMSARRKKWETPWTLYFWDKKSYEADGVTPVLTGSVRSPFTDPRLTQAAASQLAVNLTGLINYDRKFNGVHSLTFLAGVTREKVNNEDFWAYRRYFISSYIDQLSVGGTKEQNIGNDGATGNPYGQFLRARLSYFGRLGYNYKEKYMAEFLWRADGSYIFPPTMRFGFFPGVSAGWRISEEPFFKNHVSFFNNLKIRGSWGRMGAEAYDPAGNLAEFQYLATLGFGSYILGGDVAKSLIENNLPNPDFSWEVANNSNIGLEGSLLSNHISFDFDYFYNKRTKILINRGGSIPTSSGIVDKLPPVNLGVVTNKGWEFKVGYNGAVHDFNYSISVNGGYAKNKVNFWDETPGAPAYQRSTGMPINAPLAYQYDGVFATQAEIDANKIDYSALTGSLRPGDMKFKDVNNDGKINGDDEVRLDKVQDPTFTGGVNIAFSYKGFDAAILFQGATGGLQLIGLTESGDIGNFTKYAYDNRWTVDNQNSVDPRLANRNNTYYTDVAKAGWNTYWLRNNNYLRLKNVEIGYTAQPEFLKRAGIQSVRLFVNGLNLVTWDKIKIWDPESTNSSGQYYPQAKVINTGISVNF